MPTPRRLHRIAEVIHNRQLDLIFALDRVHDQHNLSAVLRSADATGINRVIWFPDIKKPDTLNPEVSKGSEKWVQLETVDNLKAPLELLKAKGYRIAATHMGREAVDFRSIDWTQPWIVVMGNEQRGCSDEILELADANIFLPMAGFVQSLNISVASAVIMYEIQRQRQNAGLYSKNADQNQIVQLFEQWSLEQEECSIEDLLQRPRGPRPDPEIPHSDGRSVRKIPRAYRAKSAD
ncbi:MAG: RNA methyltransferase [Candidatus Riflebacteria bacterium]